MKWIEFRNALIGFRVFSTGDAKKHFPDLDTRRLVEWQKKNYIQKLTNKWYLFSEIPMDELLRFRISNCLCQPSYVSLQSALAHYHFIPELVYTQQAVTTRKTVNYQTPAGSFQYSTIKPAFYFGYHVLHKDHVPVLIAEPEKALLDYLYHTSSLNTIKDMEAVRFNHASIQDAADWNKLERYAKIYESRILDKRIRLLKKIISHDDIS